MSIENVILTTDHCRYCLMCRHVCPVGNVTHLETLTPHGWGLAIASVRRGLLDWQPGTVSVLYSCADCGACRAHCVTDQPLPDAIAAARAQVAERGLAPPLAYELNTALWEWGNSYEKLSPQPLNGQGEVALFVGDAAAYLWPGTLKAVLKLLEAAGTHPALIGLGRNNGYLASSLGFPETAQNLAQATLTELRASGARQMLVLSPGDLFTFQQLYEERLGIEWPQDVALEEVITYLSNRFLENGLAFVRGQEEAPYAYIDPTHSVRVPARFEAPRKLLEAVLPGPRRELFWRRERTQPVGDTALQFTNPHLAAHLTEARLADAQRSGASLIITEDPACLSALSARVGKYGLQMIGLYELLADHLVQEPSQK